MSAGQVRSDLKLAEKGARIAVHYYRNRDAAQATLEKIQELGSNGFLVQADVCWPGEVRSQVGGKGCAYRGPLLSQSRCRASDARKNPGTRVERISRAGGCLLAR